MSTSIPRGMWFYYLIKNQERFNEELRRKEEEKESKGEGIKAPVKDAEKEVVGKGAGDKISGVPKGNEQASRAKKEET